MLKKYEYPFSNSKINKEIIKWCDYGRETGNWQILLEKMSVALKDDLLVGPFFFHAEMKIKGKSAYNWCIVEIDHDNIQKISVFLDTIGGYEFVKNKYADFFKHKASFPNHLPARILAANKKGNAGQPHQVAWFLDQFLPNIELQSDDQNICGLELITSWEALFEEVYTPALVATFDKETVTTFAALSAGFSLGTIATFAAIIHDAGHGMGANACLPSLPLYSKEIPLTWYGALGELTTDMAALALLSSKVPFLISFILPFRLFGYIRKGIEIDKKYAGLNHDYDQLAGAVLFQVLFQKKVISRNGNQWHLEFNAIEEVAYHLLVELNTLGNQLSRCVNTGDIKQIKPIATKFFSQFIEQDKKGCWLLPKNYYDFCLQSVDLPLEPNWNNVHKHYELQNKLDMSIWQEKIKIEQKYLSKNT